MDRREIWRFPEGSRKQGKVDRYFCNVICVAPMTAEVKGLRWDEMNNIKHQEQKQQVTTRFCLFVLPCFLCWATNYPGETFYFVSLFFLVTKLMHQAFLDIARPGLCCGFEPSSRHSWDKPSSACGWSGVFLGDLPAFAPPNDWLGSKSKWVK